MSAEVTVRAVGNVPTIAGVVDDTGNIVAYRDIVKKSRIDFLIGPESAYVLAVSPKLYIKLELYGSFEEMARLRAEGIANDILRIVQDKRREMGLNISEYIDVSLVYPGTELDGAEYRNGEKLQKQGLIREIYSWPIEGSHFPILVGIVPVLLYIRRAQNT